MAKYLAIVSLAGVHEESVEFEMDDQDVLSLVGSDLTEELQRAAENAIEQSGVIEIWFEEKN